MANTMPRNYHGARLVTLLKEARTAAGLSQTELAEVLHFTIQKISRIENGQLPGYHELRAMLDFLQIPAFQWDRYLQLWHKAQERGWWHKLRIDNTHYIGLEDAACRKIEFQLGYLPTLLQTEDYARALLASRGMPASTVERHISVLMRRQQRLSSDHPLSLHAFIHETVLCNQIDDKQLENLLRCAQLPNVSLQIVPQNGKLLAGLHGSLRLLSFDDDDQPDIAFTETLLGCRQVQDSDDLAAVTRALEQIARLALTTSESIAVIERKVRKDDV
jgi:transcriptional regulator with XRE-family HTH domain